MKKLHSIFSVPNKKLLVKSFFQCQEKEQDIYVEIVSKPLPQKATADCEWNEHARYIFGS